MPGRGTSFPLGSLLLPTFPPQKFEQFAYVTACRLDGEPRVYSILVPGADLGFGDIAVTLQIQDYLVGGPFGYPNIITDFSD